MAKLKKIQSGAKSSFIWMGTCDNEECEDFDLTSWADGGSNAGAISSVFQMGDNNIAGVWKSENAPFVNDLNDGSDNNKMLCGKNYFIKLHPATSGADETEIEIPGAIFDYKEQVEKGRVFNKDSAKPQFLGDVSNLPSCIAKGQFKNLITDSEIGAEYTTAQEITADKDGIYIKPDGSVHRFFKDISFNIPAGSKLLKGNFGSIDTDGDGIPDTHDTEPDVSDRQTYTGGGDPGLTDTDGDGIPDTSDPEPFSPNAIMGRSRMYWDTTAENNTGALKVDWNFLYEGPGTVTEWLFYETDGYGDPLTSTVKSSSQSQPYYRDNDWPNATNMTVPYTMDGRVQVKLADGTLSELSEEVEIRTLDTLDDPVNYGNFRYNIQGTNPYWDNYNQSEWNFNGSYTAISGITFNGAPVFKNSIERNNETKCIVLQHLAQGYQEERYGSTSWHHWVFTDWSNIVSTAGYPNFPTPSDSDPSSFITLPITSFRTLSSMGNIYRTLNGCMDSFERKHPGLFALNGMTIKTYYDADTTPYQMTAINNNSYRAIYSYDG